MEITKEENQNFKKSNIYIQKARKRFIWFSVLGLLAISIVSIVSLKYHEIVVEQQKLTQDLYSKLSKQFLLINKVSNISERFEDNKTGEDLVSLKENFGTALADLKSERESFANWINNNKFSEIQEVYNLLKDKKVHRKMEAFISTAEGLLNEEYNDYLEIKKAVRYLAKSSSSGLGETFNTINLKIKEIQDSSLDDLHQTGTVLLLLTVFQVVFLWALIFRPLYNIVFTQQKGMAKALIQAQSASRSKTDFLANISHEIRTPMTAILGYAGLLKSEKLSREELEKSLEIINQNATHLLGLIDEILDISKIEAGKFHVENEKVDVFTLLNEVYSLIGVKASEKNIKLNFESEGQIPEEVLIDPKRLKQILFNIIGNSIKFTDQGSVSLKVNYNYESRSLFFEVKDTGKGIAPEMLKKLFKPFQQVDTSVSRVHGGAGLGLALSKGIAEAMGGTIRVLESREDVGTTIEIEIKANLVKKQMKTNNLKQEELEKKSIDIRDKLKKRKILVVDDAKENAELFRIYLNMAGAEVQIANDGVKAIEYVEKYKEELDLILLDLQMPGRDGFQVLKELHSGGFEKPIVALTAHAMQEEKTKTKEAGFNAHITKPVTAETLVQTVLELI